MKDSDIRWFLIIINKVIPLTHPCILMVKWNYVQDVKKEKAEVFCEEKMKANPDRVYLTATARSNNPGMVAVYYREK